MLRLFNISFKNPVFLASGVFGFGLKYKVVTNSVGAFFTKGVTMEPRAGNPPPRIFETPSGLINWVGLENPGVKVFCTHILPQLRTLRTRIFVNVAGFYLDEFAQVIDMIGDEVDGFELNISCPNVKQGGVAFGQDAGLAASVVACARKRTKRPLIAKLTPNFCNPQEIARACVDAGADGISLINTVYGLAYDIYKKQPLIKGGLSGPAIKPFALFCVNHVKDCGVPVIGMGGITSGRDAYEFLLAGATAVAVGSAVLRDPYAPVRIIKELRGFMGTPRNRGS